ncbi:MAG: ATP synthase F1 subunit delta [Clostridiales bacterium]|nr:ATP synthase F1 subunit delta [Clostridiales bacterium]
MAELAVDLTYGTALVEAAREVGKEDQILEEAQAVVQLIEDEPDLHQFINYPGVSADEKKEVLKNIFEGRICEELLNFLYILVDKRRTMNFGRIVKVYKSLVEREEGVSYGTVYSVVKLSDERMAELEEQTSKLLQMNVKLENELDPSLLAGFKILVEGKIIDASYRKKFDELASQMNLS